MSVLVDTPVWSEMLRRMTPNPNVLRELRAVIEAGEALVIGPVRQEVLTGIRSKTQYQLLRHELRNFPNVSLRIADFELVADFNTDCRAKGIQGSPTDFLICAVAKRLGAEILTLDKDFEQYVRVLPVKLRPI